MDRQLSMDNQILYKLGQIESRIAGIDDKFNAFAERLDQRIEEEKLETARDLAALDIKLAAAVAAIKIQVDRNEKALNGVVTWKEAWATRAAWTLGFFGIGWTLFSEVVLEYIKRVVN